MVLGTCVLDEKYTHGMSGEWNYDVHMHNNVTKCSCVIVR